MAEPAAQIPPERRERNPLITPEGWALLQRLTTHADAPRWTHQIGDRLQAEDLAAARVYGARALPPHRWDLPAPELLAWLEGLGAQVPLARRALGGRGPGGWTPARWAAVPRSGREELALHPEWFCPDDHDLGRLIAYVTSGTTAPPLYVPSHPAVVALNHPLLERALGRWGLEISPGPHSLAVLNLNAQHFTWVFATVFAVWGDAGFAKVNLNPAGWPEGVDSLRRFLLAHPPQVVTATPVALAEALRLELPLRPRAITSTAMALDPALRARCEQAFGCPVLDWYSLTETGPLAASAPGGEGLALLAPDVHVEITDPDGAPLPYGALGEVVVSGGHNPAVPLIRYRTGDHARLLPGDPPRLVDLQGRGVAAYRTPGGHLASPVDLARVMRDHGPSVEHRFTQRTDGTLELRLRPVPGHPPDLAALRAGLGEVMAGGPVEVVLDEALGQEQKVLRYGPGGAPC